MKRILIGMMFLLFIIQLVNATEVCVVVDYGKDSEEKPDSKCVDIDEGMNGYDVLEATGFDVLWTPVSMWGQMACKINDVGTNLVTTAYGESCYYDPVKKEFWNFVLVDGTEWGHSPVGFNGGNECWNRDFSWSDLIKVVHYCVKNGDVVGLAFGKEGSEPQMFKANISKVYVDGQKQKRLDEDGGKIQDVLPGSEVEFKVELENMYESGTNIKVRDVSITGTIEEINNGGDIEEKIEEFDIGVSQKEIKSLKFKIPLEVEEKDRLLTIELKAEDDAGIRYVKEFRYDLEIKKEQHQLKIIKAQLDKDSYKCGENALLDVSILNMGKQKESSVLRITNDALELNINKDFELSSDAFEKSARYEDRLSIGLPDYLENAAYPLDISIEYGTKKETANVSLVVGECGSEKASGAGKGSKEGNEVAEVKTGQSSEEKGQLGGKTGEKSATANSISVIINKNLPLVLIAVLTVLVIIIVALFVIFWVIRR